MEANATVAKAELSHGLLPAVTYTSPWSGYLTPENLHAAYALPDTSPAGVVPASSTQTVGIVDAYDDPNAESDLAVYDSEYGLPACTTANGCFSKVNQEGLSSPMPTPEGGWGEEISLDVQMVHSICQDCHVLLVEANSASFTSMEAAVKTAVRLGATEVTNSYAGVETQNTYSGDSSYNYPGVVITAASGDNGYLNNKGGAAGVNYPASSPDVVSVSGTNLTNNGSGWQSSVWSSAGSGCSHLFLAPLWQSSVSAFSLTGCGSMRSVADVAAVSAPGLDVYDSYPAGNGSATGWQALAGTSAASPIVAAEFALAGGSHEVSYPAATLYSHFGNASDITPITSGSNGSCSSSACNADSGFSGPAGVGSPLGLGAFTSSSLPPAPVNTVSPSVSGTAVDDSLLTASGGTWSNNPHLRYQWEDCDSSGANCADVTGEAIQPTYFLQDSDVGHTIRVVVTASNAGGAVIATSPASSLVAASAPGKLEAPAIQNAVGQTIKAGAEAIAYTGQWNGTGPLDLALQWQLCNSSCENIVDATGEHYTVPSADLGASLRLKVTVTNALGNVTAFSSLYAVTSAASGGMNGWSFQGTSSMGSARYGQTSTLLPDGDVLIAGGDDSGNVLSSAELFDPAGNHGSGSFAPTGSMNTSRYQSTATLLPDGDVLIAGGFSNSGAVESAELFNPAANNGAGGFTELENMASARYDASATLLQSGEVLITGGNNGGGAVSSAELFNPAANNGVGAFSSTGSMSRTRENQTSTLLPGGDVLIAGGDNGPSVMANAELYNPSTGSFVATGAMAHARADQTSTLLPNGEVLIAGGLGGGGAVSSAELFSLAGNGGAGTFTATGNMTSPRANQSADLLPNGEVLIAGGKNTSGQTQASAEIFNPGDDSFREIGVMTTARFSQTATVLQNGEVLLSGGLDGNTYLASAELYSPNTPPTPAAVSFAGTPSGSGTVNVPYTITSGQYPVALITCFLDGEAVACGSSSSTLSNVGASEHQFTVRVVDSAGNISEASVSWNAGAGLNGVTQPPSPGSTLPQISGTTTEGQTLSTSNGTFEGGAVSAYSYQWYQGVGSSCASKTAIIGATKHTYSLQASDVGSVLCVVVTATNSAGAASETSPVTSAVIPLAPVSSTPLPLISVQSGTENTFVTTNGGWSGGAVSSYSYQWHRSTAGSCSAASPAISGATASTYVLGSPEGGNLCVVVTATNTGGSAQELSASVALPPAPPSTTAGIPVISGSSIESETLSATSGSFSGGVATKSYQWHRSSTSSCSVVDAAISGATAASYELTGSDVGFRVCVVVTASNASGSAYETSAPTEVVVAASTPSAPVVPTPEPPVEPTPVVPTPEPPVEPTPVSPSPTSPVSPAPISPAPVSPTPAPVSPAPITASPPVIAGTKQVGQKLAATNGDWNVEIGLSYSYQWQSCNSLGGSCSSIPGATGADYVPTVAVMGRTIKVVVTASNASGSASATSATTSIVLPTTSGANTAALSAPAKNKPLALRKALFAPHQIYLLGETQPRFAEKVITLFQSGHGHAIAEARVNADGTFVLLTAMPSSKVLIYRVRVGKTFSSPTKLIVPKPSR